MWKLEIHDSGDHSVGIFSQAWYVDVPFDVSTESEFILSNFKMNIAMIYVDFCEGTMYIKYIEIDNEDDWNIIQVKE